jgi:glutamine amidotransferase
MIAIIDYKAGNLKSVELAFKTLGCACHVTQDSEKILASDRIVFPGVGAAGKAIQDLRSLNLHKALIQAFEAGKPILGICLGAQIILDRSEENHTKCLGIISGHVKRFPIPLVSEDNERLKIPHMGWNGVKLSRSHPVFKEIGSSHEFYFVHSYYPMPASDKFIIGWTDYGIDFPSVIGYRNLIAMQFHPEKSGAPGLNILKNFSVWDGSDAQ